MKTTCIMCPVGCELTIEKVGDEIKVTGNGCIRGQHYGQSELTNPMRMVTALISTDLGVLPVKTTDLVPKSKIDDVLKAVDDGKLFPAKFEDGQVKSGVKVTVSGQIKINYFNGNFNQIFEFTRLNVVKEDTPCEFSGSVSLVFNKEAVKERKDKFIVNGYVYDYIKPQGHERGEMKLLPQTLVVNKKDELGERIGQFLMENMKTKKDEFYACRFDVKFIKGAEEVEPEDIKPTDEQKMLIELGLLDISDIMEKAVGRKINEVRIDKIYAKGDYKRFSFLTNFKQKDVFVEEEEEDIYEEESIFNTSDDEEDDELPFNVDDLPF